ncbi:hypothetical protein PRK78_006687 [Emydomyces testavorans]|uniref:Uncharacterized protein n=1 Tax=Emydomyces testavorans TaxID=2070801 RepID=A0AAF0ILY6_9EURO|nr:hypothetical protein PRK78_006687 [Emydomyces testavorans]
MAIYIGDSADWKALRASAGDIRLHPIERFAGFLTRDSKGIVEDPTDLLRSQVSHDQKELHAWMPQSLGKAAVYQPTAPNNSASLLWGEHNGFQRRCSRGIIALPPKLWTVSPKLNSGLCGKAVCLAYGILARNKGLEPASLICNLKAKNSFRMWEEGSLFPLMSKTLRSFYYIEFRDSFRLLGDSFITAAAELAVLLTVVDHSLVRRWLDAGFEHQDLELNFEAHYLGASPEALDRLYRGHYVAMLISLCLYHKGVQIRPEITVFDAVCDLESVSIPLWALSDSMQARRDAELAQYGPSLRRLVHAAI